MHAPNQSFSYTQSSIDTHKEHVNNTPHASDTAHSFYTQPLTQITQTFCPSVTSTSINNH
jgi:hypothetical protein